MEKPIRLGSIDIFQHASIIFILDHKGELVAIDRHGQVVEGVEERELQHGPAEALAFGRQARCWVTCTINGVTKRYLVPCS